MRNKMKNLGVLYRFEVKKIGSRKIVWITAFLMVLVVLISVGSPLLGAVYVDGVMTETNYQAFQLDKAYQLELDGRSINQELLAQMQAGYDKIPEDAESYITTKEYQTYARPYSAIFQFVRRATGMTVAEAMQWTAEEQDMYAKRQQALEEAWEDALLTRAEKDFWQSQEERLVWPLTFRYQEGWALLFDGVYTLGIVTIVAVAVCLAGVFPDEHTRKTDQQTLSSKYGRGVLYLAKYLAGISFSVGLAFLFVTTALLEAVILYGADGFSSSFQLLYPKYSYPLSMGGAVLICFGVIVLAAALTGAFVMMLSAFLHSSIGTLSAVVGMVILDMFFSVPEQYRVFYQLWSYLPSEMVGVWNLFTLRTVPVFGRCLLSWQVVPVLYLFLGALFCCIGTRAYVRYQVSGR